MRGSVSGRLLREHLRPCRPALSRQAFLIAGTAALFALPLVARLVMIGYVLGIHFLFDMGQVDRL